MNIIEEIFEMYGVGDCKDRSLALWVTAKIEAVADDLSKGYTIEGVTYKEPTVDDAVDSLCDMQSFAGGDVNKLGYSNKKC